MSCWRRLLLPAALVALVVVPARAQIAGHPYEVSVGAGLNDFDSRIHVKDSPAFDLSAGWRWSDDVTFGLSWLKAPSHMDVPSKPKHDWSLTSLDALWMLRDPSERATPYLLAGIGFGRSLQDPVSEHVSGTFARSGAASVGLGLRFNVANNQRSYVRLQARDVMFREPNETVFSQHIAVTAALTWVYGGRAKDQDADGVRNWLDGCPRTPLGAKVDAKGCPTDSDRDSVWDGLDKCPDTPKGCKVDSKGCSIDTDGDGVCDGLDQCPDTPKGATVDAKGCPIDSDGDGVWDGLDKCPGTPKGCQIDSTGCSIDTDGDGVCDGLDQCPNTPAGLRVDPNGCPIEVSQRETELLDTGTIRLQGINFDTNKASIRDSVSFATLDDVAKILLQYPALTLEIGGHTDTQGQKAKNMVLSEARAKSVLGYLVQKYPTLDATHFTVKGYGPTVPVASNNTALGRAKNRRVEFKVTNTEALKIEREKRHLLLKGEGVPADSTRAH